MTGAIADLFFTKYNGNILGVTRVHWRIYSLGVEQYIPRRFAPLDILHNPSGVYSPMYPCHTHYIITMAVSENDAERELGGRPIVRVTS